MGAWCLLEVFQIGELSFSTIRFRARGLTFLVFLGHELHLCLVLLQIGIGLTLRSRCGEVAHLLLGDFLLLVLLIVFASAHAASSSL